LVSKLYQSFLQVYNKKACTNLVAKHNVARFCVEEGQCNSFTS